MKITMNYRYFSVISLLTLFPLLTQGQEYSEKRTYSKTIRVNREMTLEVNNKYGNIHITPWRTDSLSVRVEVDAFAQNRDRLARMFQGIDIDISETDYLVRAQTDFSQSITMLFESFKGMTKKIIPYESSIRINYFINAPEYLSMNIINRYGDVYAEDNSGTFTLDLSNGSFKANSLNRVKNLELNFCDATINRINSGEINVSFSEMVIGEAQDLTINSISSRFNIARAEIIQTESRRDKFFIGKAGTLRGDSYFTDFRIDELSKELNISTKYGSLNADMIDKSIELVTINSGFTDISLVFDPVLSYNLDIRHVNAFVVLPQKDSKIEKKAVNEENKEYMTFGRVGRNPGSLKVFIDANRGNIHLK